MKTTAKYVKRAGLFGILLLSIWFLSGAPANAAEKAPKAPKGDAHTSIVGGYYPGSGQWPWMVSIQTGPRTGNNAFDRHWCGGALVSRRLVVTAAHCMEDYNDNYWPVRSLSVMTGRQNLLGGGGRRIGVYDYKIHRSYGYPKDYAYDLALVFLKRKARYSPAPLLDGDVTLYEGDSVTAMGWGNTVSGTDTGYHPTPYIKAVDLNVWADETCAYWAGAASNQYDLYRRLLHFPSELCAAIDVEYSDGTCQGDSGGPLMTQYGGRWRLVGLVSWGGIGCYGSYDPTVFSWLQNGSMQRMIYRGIARSKRLSRRGR